MSREFVEDIEKFYPKKQLTEDGFLYFCAQLQLTEEEKRDKRILESLKEIYNEASTTCWNDCIGGKFSFSRESEFGSKSNSKIKISFFQTYNNENYNEKNMNRNCSIYELFIDNNDNMISQKKVINAHAEEGKNISYQLSQTVEITNPKGEVTNRVEAGTYLLESKPYGSKMPYFNEVRNYGTLAFNNLDNDLLKFYPDMNIAYNPEYSTIYLNNINRGVNSGWGYSEKRNPDEITATVTNYYYDENGRKVQFAIDPEAGITCDNIRNKKHMRIDGKIYTDKNTIENIIANQSQGHTKR